MGSRVRTSPLGWACCSLCLLAAASGERAHDSASADALRLDDGEAEAVGINRTIADTPQRTKKIYESLDQVKNDMKQAKMFSQEGLTSIDKKMQDVHDAVVKTEADKKNDKIGSDVANAVAAAGQLKTGIQTFRAACAGDYCEPSKVAQGVLSIVGAAAVFLPPPYNVMTAGVIDVAGLIFELFDGDKKAEDTMAQVVEKEVMAGFNKFATHLANEKIHLAQSELREFRNHVLNTLDQKARKPEDPLLVAENAKTWDANDKLRELIAVVEHWILQLPDPPSIGYSSVMELNGLKGHCECSGWNSVGSGNVDWHPCKSRIDKMCKYEELCKSHWDTEADQKQCLRDIRSLRGDPTIYHGDCFHTHFPHGHMATECNGGFNIYNDKTDTSIHPSWTTVAAVIRTYYTLHALKLHNVVRMKQFWVPHDVPSRKNWADSYKSGVADMKKVRRFLKKKSEKEAQRIHQFNLKMQDGVCHWRQSSAMCNRAEGWMMAWMERPEMFMRYAGEAFGIADSFVRALDPAPETPCPYVALEFGKSCHDSWDTAEISDKAECAAADSSQCMESSRPQSLMFGGIGLKTDYTRGRLGKDPNSRKRPTGCFVEDVEGGGLAWNTFRSDSQRGLIPWTAHPTNVRANYVSAFPVCHNLNFLERPPECDQAGNQYYAERSLVANEGGHLKSLKPFVSLQQCKDTCTSTPGCNSFVVCRPDDRYKTGANGCYMKTKVVALDDAANTNGAWQQHTCKTYFKSTPTCTRVYTRRSLVANEGGHLKSLKPFVSLQQCKDTCTSTPGCNSFAVCRGLINHGCYMKDKKVTLEEPANKGLSGSICQTYFKEA